MMKKIMYSLGLGLLCMSFLFAQEQKPDELRLTLNECLVRALENNLDISVDAFTPEIREYSIRESRERFMPQLSLSYDNWNYNTLSNWFADGTQFTTKTDILNLRLSQSLITGGDISLSLRNTTSDTTRNLVTINPTYTGELRFGISQPLLKDFGPKINKGDTRKARNQMDISVYTLKSTLVQKVYEVEDAYWNLVSAVEQLKVNEYSFEHSKEQLKMTKEAARIGAKTATDVLDAETEVANRERTVISDRAQVQRAEDMLREIMNISGDSSGMIQSIVPIDKPSVEKKEITFEEALKTALAQRPELARVQKEIENSNIDLSYFKNQTLPELNLQFEMWYPGQSGDRIIYQNNDPYTGVVVGVDEGGRSESFKDVFGLKYDNWSLRLNLNIPLSNILSRASLARAKVENKQKLLEQEREEQSIYNEIVEVFKELKNNEKSLEISGRYRELMDKKLRAGEEKYKLGLLESEWLFSYQREMANARVSEIRAIVAYKLSVAKLERILGINLEIKNLRFRDYDF
jgi:outer membrane protein TolC